MKPAICAGSGKSVPLPPTAGWWDDTSGQCEFCGGEFPLRRGCLPKHRARKCMVPGCRGWRVRGGLCKRHDADVVEADPLLDGVEVPCRP